jgi:Protein of unknown function (DUF2817)
MGFSADYFSARERFRKAACGPGWRLESAPMQARGPSGEELTVDVAISNGQAAASVLILTSGLHGIEGFFGSAVLCSLLEQKALGLDGSGRVRLVLVHALNPFGFSPSY